MKVFNIILILVILILTLFIQACSDKPNPSDTEILNIIQTELKKVEYSFGSCIPDDNYLWSNIKITSFQIQKKIKSQDDYYLKISVNGEGERSETLSWSQWGPKMKPLGKGLFSNKEMLIRFYKPEKLWVYEVIKCPFLNPMGSEW